MGCFSDFKMVARVLFGVARFSVFFGVLLSCSGNTMVSVSLPFLAVVIFLPGDC